MSITSLTSPPEKSSRRVRFSLPEAKLTFSHGDKRTLHGTNKYVNGTLINVTSTIHSTNELCKSTNSRNDINGGFKSNLKSNGNNNLTGKEYRVSLNIRPATTKEHGRNSLPMTTTSGTIAKRQTSKMVIRNADKSFNILPIIERKSSSLEDFDEDSLDGDCHEENSHELKGKSVTNLTRYKSSDDLRDPNNFKVKNTVVKLPEAPNGAANFTQKRSSTCNTLKVPHYSDPAPSLSCETRKLNSETVLCDKKNDRLSASDGNLEQFFEFVDKWRANRLAGNKKIDDIFRNSSCE